MRFFATGCTFEALACFYVNDRKGAEAVFGPTEKKYCFPCEMM